MNAFGAVLKVLAAAAVIAGAVFVVIAYGEKIVAFFKKLLGRFGCSCNSDFVDECDLEDAEEEVVASEQDFSEEE